MKITVRVIVFRFSWIPSTKRLQLVLRLAVYSELGFSTEYITFLNEALWLMEVVLQQRVMFRGLVRPLWRLAFRAAEPVRLASHAGWPEPRPLSFLKCFPTTPCWIGLVHLHPWTILSSFILVVLRVAWWFAGSSGFTSCTKQGGEVCWKQFHRCTVARELYCTPNPAPLLMFLVVVYCGPL